MDKIFKVAVRDYIETVSTKTFMISLLLTPVLVGGIIFISIRMQEKGEGPQPPRHVAAVNVPDELTADLDSAFSRYNESHPQGRIILERQAGKEKDQDALLDRLREEVRSGALEAFCVLDDDILEGKGGLRFYTRKAMEFDFSRTIRSLFNEAIVNRRFINNGLSPKMVNELSRWVPLEVVDLSAKKEKKMDSFAIFMVPFFFMFLMFFGIILIGQNLLMSVIEEKSSRVIEVLLTSVSPFQLMAGKILGLGGVGITLVGIYGIASYITASLRGLGHFLNPGMIGYFIVYFLLGFLIFSSLTAAIGAACNSHKEAQNLMAPLIMIVLMPPMVLWFSIVQHPEGTLATVLSFIPPITPMVMILRLAARPDLPVFQIIASLLLLLLSVPVFMWAAAKIFRTGILMYGKPPGVREILRWLRSG